MYDMIYTVHCTDSLQIIILGVSNWFMTQYGIHLYDTNYHIGAIELVYTWNCRVYINLILNWFLLNNFFEALN